MLKDSVELNQGLKYYYFTQTGTTVKQVQTIGKIKGKYKTDTKRLI